MDLTAPLKRYIILKIDSVDETKIFINRLVFIFGHLHDLFVNLYLVSLTCGQL